MFTKRRTTIAGIIGAALVSLLKTLGVDLDAQVAAAIPVILGWIIGFLTKPKENPEL